MEEVEAVMGVRSNEVGVASKEWESRGVRPGVSEAVKNKLAESVKIRYWGLRMSWSFTSSATSRCRSNDLPHPSNTLFDSSMIFRFKRRDQFVPPIQGIQLWKEISLNDIAQMCYIFFFLCTWDILSLKRWE